MKRWTMRMTIAISTLTTAEIIWTKTIIWTMVQRTKFISFQIIVIFDKKYKKKLNPKKLSIFHSIWLSFTHSAWSWLSSIHSFFHSVRYEMSTHASLVATNHTLYMCVNLSTACKCFHSQLIDFGEYTHIRTHNTEKKSKRKRLHNKSQTKFFTLSQNEEKTCVFNWSFAGY